MMIGNFLFRQAYLQYYGWTYRNLDISLEDSQMLISAVFFPIHPFPRDVWPIFCISRSVSCQQPIFWQYGERRLSIFLFKVQIVLGGINNSFIALKFCLSKRLKSKYYLSHKLAGIMWLRCEGQMSSFKFHGLA